MRTILLSFAAAGLAVAALQGIEATATTAARSMKPALSWEFSGTLHQVGTCSGPPHAQRPSCADVMPANASTEFAASESRRGGSIVAKPVGPYNDKDFVTFDNLDDYQVTPFFNETVCYLLNYQPPGGGQQGAQFKAAVYHYFGVDFIMEGRRYAFEVYYSKAIATGRSAHISGQTCAVYSYHCGQSPGGGDPNCDHVDFCVTSGGHLLSINSTSKFGTADPDKFLTVSKTIVVEDFVADPPASTFALPVDSAQCLQLKSESYEKLSPQQMHAHDSTTQVNDQARLAAINEEASELGWFADQNEAFDNWTVSNTSLLTKAMWRFGPLSLPGHVYDARQHFIEIPSSFDARQQWPDCKSIRSIRNQGNCGSCWAFAAMESLADRFCVADKQAYADLTLSAQYAMGCDTQGHGCNGGYIDEIWGYLRDHGTTTESCDPYKHCPQPSSETCGGGPPAPPAPPGASEICDTKCKSGSTIGPSQLYRASSAYAVSKPGDVAAIQAEIMQHGPVEVGYYVFSDFQSYRNGIYKRTPSAQGPTGKHAVKLVGWGEERGQPYWIVANSWSPAWGDSGFFRIARGTNECGIEMVPAAGLPQVQKN